MRKFSCGNLNEFICFRGMNCLHVLSSHCKDNAQQILETILKHHSTFPLDIQDGQGNTG